jgi:hypothetical protein
MSVKTKTQITVNDDLSLIVSAIKHNFPIFDTNQAIEFLVAKGSGVYLNELNLTLQDLKDIEISRQQIRDGKSTKANSIDDLLQKLKS